MKGVTNKLADGTVIDQFSYTYDGAGNQRSKIEFTNGVIRGETTYTYDKQNRLESVTEPTGTVTSYTYDKAGNRETETTVEHGVEMINRYTYNAAGYRVAKESYVDGKALSQERHGD